MTSTTCSPAIRPLGGERHSRNAVRAWFERLFRLYDELRFEIQRVIVSGRPWNIVVGVEWLGHARPKAGEPYVNEGFHVINIRRGRVVYFHAYEDSQKVAEACRQMADAGIEEAAAAPIVGRSRAVIHLGFRDDFANRSRVIREVAGRGKLLMETAGAWLGITGWR